ncbi:MULTISPECIES: N-acetylmuramoyl-L-alanine amidase [Pandoraea]|uniref:N-acetylmuramoyl-L-alanine amidase n=1 Tax=Pandoraea TaxID=93217 RepID=UPI001F5DC8FC|nr:MULTISPECIES: N-acetylmuramoyl-L-alanine amidase [Pandoraea]
MLIKRFARTDDASSLNAGRRRALRAGASTLILALTGPRLAFANAIVAVRVWPARDYTRVTLETDNPVKFQQQLMESPNRFVIDLDEVDLNPALRDLVAKIQPNDPQIAQVRVGQFKPGVVRMVFDLKAGVKPQSFTLPPVAGYKYRTVFDLYPAVEPDPLMELLAQTANKAQALAQNSQPPHTSQPSSGAGTPSTEESEAFFQRYAQREPGQRPSRPSPATPSAPATPDKTPPLAQRKDDDDDTYVSPPRGPKTARLLTIALDPGHGGEDPGAIGGAGTYEKVVVLQIAKRLRQKIENEPNMRVMMTRDADFFVPLGVRVQKARRVEADLFMSIHADAFTSPSANGASVFALSERGATSATARLLEKTQNASDLIGGVNIKTNDRTVAHALLDMSTTAQIRDSKVFGSALLAQIGTVAPRLHSPNVEQASFAVLKAPDIPSVLVETAFISNPNEERNLIDPAYQDRLADALLKGIKAYFAKNPPIAKNRTA